jgi:aryl-alcohol dehydrogenase-like predicted oxidoreductase
MSWLIANPLAACAIVGATTAAQVEENVRAAGWALTGRRWRRSIGFARSQLAGASRGAECCRVGKGA